MVDNFNPWPCGPVPDEWQRSEIGQLKKAGYNLSVMGILDEFERKISEFAGSKYGVAVSSATNAIFLSLLYLKYMYEISDRDTITIPARTYVSVPMSIVNANLKVRFEHIDWSGVYQLKPTRIWDGSVRFTEDMYIPDTLQILSFQYKKRLPIGRGGMILTNDENAVKWLKMARFNGRHHDIDQWHDKFDIRGWNMYMTPDDAARGILLFDQLPKVNPDSACQNNYPDLSNQEVFKR